MKQVNLLENSSYSRSGLLRGHTENYTCSQDGARICYLRNINSLVENQKSGSQHTHNCRPVMHSGAGDQRNHSESEICQKPGQKKEPNSSAMQQDIFHPYLNIFVRIKGNLYLMPKREAFF